MRDLSEIKALRKKLNLTQTDLARESGLSQSLIAKIESGGLEPSYNNARKILNSIEKISLKQETKAKNLMNIKVISCQENENLKELIKKMKKHEISQMPVLKGNVVVGFVSETDLLEHVFDKNIDNLKAKDVMQATPPSISEETPESVVLPLLRYFPLVVVQDQGKIKGLITKSDIIMKAYS